MRSSPSRFARLPLLTTCLLPRSIEPWYRQGSPPQPHTPGRHLEEAQHPLPPSLPINVSVGGVCWRPRSLGVQYATLGFPFDPGGLGQRRERWFRRETEGVVGMVPGSFPSPIASWLGGGDLAECPPTNSNTLVADDEARLAARRSAQKRMLEGKGAWASRRTKQQGRVLLASAG